jgi:chemotaxis protein methyltransferase CheR
MLLLEHFPALDDWDVKIVGTDISRSVLEYAARARYRRNEVNRGLPAKMLVKYFERDGEEWEVSRRVRALCDFGYANLCAPLPPLPVFDLVLLRNVLLYFPEQDRSCVFADVHARMNPRGFLLLGNSEEAEESTDQFEMEFAADSYYYRPRARY